MQEKFNIYRSKALGYLENAHELLKAEEADKAGELLWGAFAEALKGLAARRGILLSSHGQVRNYARGLAAEMGDPSIWDTYRDAEFLHSDFYETPLTPDDILPSAEKIREGVGKLIRMMEQPLA